MKVNPRRITIALDARNLFGPEVDAALDVPEPTVDMWEAGVVEPTPAQLARLAMLTDFPVGWFLRQDPPVEITSGWICGRRCEPLQERPTAQAGLW